MVALHSKPNRAHITLDEYEKMFKQHYAELCVYATSILGNDGQAEEIVQELFTKLWDKREKLYIQNDVKTYLMKAVKNSCMMYFRSQHNKKYMELDQAADVVQDYPQAIQELSVKEISQIIDKTLNDVPERWKEIFSMIRFEGYKYREVAEKLSISVKTVEKTMGQMLRLFRNNLVEYISIIAGILTIV